MEPIGDLDRIQHGAGQARELAVGAEETGERFGATADDVEAAGHVLAPVFRERVAFENSFQAAGNRLDRGEGVGDLVAEDTDQTLPGLEFFFAEGAREVRDDEKLVGQTAFAELRAGDAPAAETAREGALNGAGGFTREEAGEVELIGGKVDGAFSGAIKDLEFLRFVKGEYGDVDFLHDLARERCRFHEAEALGTTRSAHGVDLLHNTRQGVIAAGAAGANGMISFAHGFKTRERSAV